MTWSAFVPDDFFRGDRYVVSGGGTGETQHAIFDPETEEVTAMTVSHTNHDMFCPGITQMPNGDIVVTGGQNADKTSIYHLADGTWAEAETMNIARGYGSSCLLSNGKVWHKNSEATIQTRCLENSFTHSFMLEHLSCSCISGVKDA